MRFPSVPAHAAAEGRGSSETESSSGDAPGEDRTPEHRDERPEDAGANGPAPGPVPSREWFQCPRCGQLTTITDGPCGDCYARMHP